MIGTVKKLNSKTGTSKRGKWELFSMIMENDDGSESGWISLGFDKPSFGEGQYAEYTTEAGPKGLNLTSFTKKEKPQAPIQSNPVATQGPRSNVTTQDSIVYQSSRKDAIALVALLLENDGLPMSASAAKAGQAKRFEEITAMVDKITVEYFYDVQSGRKLRTVVDAGADEEATRTASPVSGEDDND